MGKLIASYASLKRPSIFYKENHSISRTVSGPAMRHVRIRDPTFASLPAADAHREQCRNAVMPHLLVVSFESSRPSH
jgi:hypothetical protein